jgi:hypothetical protein
MPSSGLWRRVDLVGTDVSEKRQFPQDLHGATSQKTAFFNLLIYSILNSDTIIYLIYSLQFIDKSDVILK